MAESDWLPDLRDDDIDTLMEALEAWEQKDVASEMASGLIDAMLADRPGGLPSAVVDRAERDKREREAQKRLRKERSVLLRAKLLTIRDRRMAERALG